MIKTKKKHDLSAVFLIALPLLVFWGYAAYVTFDYPYQRADPEYSYFLTSLAPFRGDGYRYVDHPGTPLEVIGSVLLGITYPFVGSGGLSGFVQYHLSDPRLFLLLAHGFMLAFSITCAAYFYRTALTGQTRDDILFAASLALMFYAIHPLSFTILFVWSHHSYNFPFGAGLLLLLYGVMQNKGRISRKRLLWLGFGAGILTAVVIYFGTWVVGMAVSIGVFYWAQGLPFKKIAADMALFWTACLSGFIFALLPAMHRLDRFTSWIISIIVHQGKHGHGETGILSIPGLLANFSTMLQANPILFLSVALEFILLLYALLRERGIFSRKPGLAALGIGLSLQILASTFIIAKHYGISYSLSIAAAVPVLALTIKGLYEETSFPGKTILKRLFIFLIITGLVVQMSISMRIQKERIENIQTLQDRISHMVNERALATGRKPEQIVLLWQQGILTPCNTLGRTNENYGNKKLDTCENQYFIRNAPIANPISLVGRSPTDINKLEWDFIVVWAYADLKNFTPFLPATTGSETVDGVTIISNGNQ